MLLLYEYTRHDAPHISTVNHTLFSRLLALLRLQLPFVLALAVYAPLLLVEDFVVLPGQVLTVR